MTKRRRSPPAEYVGAALVVALATALNAVLFRRIAVTDVAMVYVLASGIVAFRSGRWPSVFAACAGIACFDFFFVPPYFAFDVADLRFLITFAVMLVTALVISGLTLRIREQAEATREIEAERLRTSLLSSLSHDLRTPLGSITGAVTTLLDSSAPIAPADRRGLLQGILEESHRMNRLIGNLLDMIRVEGGVLLTQKEPQPIEEPLGVALIRLDDRLAGRTVSASLAPDLPLVPADGVLIEQVFVNLLENALKYTPAGTPIDITATEVSGALEVSVADRGPGIPAGEEARVFEKFFRAEGTPPGGGVGLGLTICRGIVRAHGGEIHVEPRQGGGAVFRFTLPLNGAKGGADG